MGLREEWRVAQISLALTLLGIVFLAVTAIFYAVSGTADNKTVENQTVPPEPGMAENTSLPLANDSGFPEMEEDIFEMVNRKREENSTAPLEWNEELAWVARQHSRELARENRPLTEPDLACPRPFIHHEGFGFGLYHYDRLRNSGIHYFGYSGENIFTIPAWKNATSYPEELPEECPDEERIVSPYEGEHPEEQVKEAYRELLEFAENAERVSWSEVEWYGREELERNIVSGWTNSTGHRELMLDSSFDETGIGIAKVNDYYFITQIFIERLECGYKTGPCCEEEGFYPYCFEPMVCEEGVCTIPQ
ncbi:hypothetical protein GF318_05065 [Candidatus Micrarchaeota archaeon]|nr:hypothetical protein [Candidatus Micrarchaeota archaeon]